MICLQNIKVFTDIFLKFLHLRYYRKNENKNKSQLRIANSNKTDKQKNKIFKEIRSKEKIVTLKILRAAKKIGFTRIN